MAPAVSWNTRNHERSFINCEFNFGTKYNYITTLTDGINIYKERTRHTGEEDVRGGEYWGT